MAMMNPSLDRVNRPELTQQTKGFGKEPDKILPICRKSQFVCEAKASYPHLGNLLLLYFIEIKNGKKIENINQFIYNAIN